MSTREDLEKFTTPASRELVDQFVADAADEDNNVDMNEVARQNLADHEAALTGRPQPACPKNPKPVIGYLATSDLAGLAVQPMRGWYFLPPLDLSVKAAESTRAGFQGMSPTTPAKPIYKVTITFELVERGGT